MIGRPAHQLQRKIRLHSKRDIRWPIRVDAPATVFVLMTKNLIDRSFHPAAISSPKERMDEDIVGFQHAVGFELTAPITVGMLQAEQPVLGALHPFNNMLQTKVDPPEARLCGQVY